MYDTMSEGDGQEEQRQKTKQNKKTGKQVKEKVNVVMAAQN